MPITKDKTLEHINIQLNLSKKNIDQSATEFHEKWIQEIEIRCRAVAFFAYEMGLFTLHEFIDISHQLEFIELNKFTVTLNNSLV
jgi:hypothetical protein